MTMNDLMMLLVKINAMRASLKKKVAQSLLSFLGTVADWLTFDQAEKTIQTLETSVAGLTKVFNLPEFITPKEYAELVGISRSTVYRHIKQGNIIAEKVNRRWRIYLGITELENAIA